MPIIDISLPLKKGAPVYPRNPALAITAVRGNSSTHSVIEMGSHTGTHIDAPRHLFKNGEGTDEFELDSFIGPCRVLDCAGACGSFQFALIFIETFDSFYCALYNSGEILTVLKMIQLNF